MVVYINEESSQILSLYVERVSSSSTAYSFSNYLTFFTEPLGSPTLPYAEDASLLTEPADSDVPVHTFIAHLYNETVRLGHLSVQP